MSELRPECQKEITLIAEISLEPFKFCRHAIRSHCRLVTDQLEHSLEYIHCFYVKVGLFVTISNIYRSVKICGFDGGLFLSKYPGVSRGFSQQGAKLLTRGLDD